MRAINVFFFVLAETSNKSVVLRPPRINLRKKDVTAQRRDHLKRDMMLQLFKDLWFLVPPGFESGASRLEFQPSSNWAKEKLKDRNGVGRVEGGMRMQHRNWVASS